MSNKQLATKAENLPAEFLDMVGGDAGMGTESADRDDMIVPFLKLAQSLSEEVKKSKPNYIEGLEEGDFFNSATNEVWKGEAGVRFIPVLYTKQYLEFTPRADGGGFHGQHDASILAQTEPDDSNRDMLPNGNEIVTAGTWFVLAETASGGFEQCVISCSKSQFTPSRKLMSKIKNVMLTNGDGKKFNPPAFFNVVKARSLPKSNDQGDWVVWDFSLDGNVFDLEGGADIYESAKLMLEAVQSGELKAAEHSSETDGDEVPF
jgi:hypothetical protein